MSCNRSVLDTTIFHSSETYSSVARSIIPSRSVSCFSSTFNVPCIVKLWSGFHVLHAVAASAYVSTLVSRCRKFDIHTQPAPRQGRALAGPGLFSHHFVRWFDRLACLHKRSQSLVTVLVHHLLLLSYYTDRNAWCRFIALVPVLQRQNLTQHRNTGRPH